MKFIITIDDADQATLELLLRESINFPVVVGVPAGLIGQEFEGRPIASSEILFEFCRKLDVEVASHGYYHVYPAGSEKSGILNILSRIFASPDKIDYFFRACSFLLFKNNKEVKNKTVFDPVTEFVLSKKELEKLTDREIKTFLFPGGSVDKSFLELLAENYEFARTSEVGPNHTNDFQDITKQLSLKTISFSRYTNFRRIERYYQALAKQEQITGVEFVVIESYHIITESKVSNLYSNLYQDFIRHSARLQEFGPVCKFNDINKS